MWHFIFLYFWYPTVFFIIYLIRFQHNTFLCTCFKETCNIFGRCIWILYVFIFKISYFIWNCATCFYIKNKIQTKILLIFIFFLQNFQNFKMQCYEKESFLICNNISVFLVFCLNLNAKTYIQTFVFSGSTIWLVVCDSHLCLPVFSCSFHLKIDTIFVY